MKQHSVHTKLTCKGQNNKHSSYGHLYESITWLATSLYQFSSHHDKKKIFDSKSFRQEGFTLVFGAINAVYQCRECQEVDQFNGKGDYTWSDGRNRLKTRKSLRQKKDQTMYSSIPESQQPTLSVRFYCLNVLQTLSAPQQGN